MSTRTLFRTGSLAAALGCASLLSGAPVQTPTAIQDPALTPPQQSPAVRNQSSPLPQSAGLTEPAANGLLPSEPVSAQAAVANDPTTNIDWVDSTPAAVLPKWKFTLGAAVRVLHDDNIFIQPRNEVEDWIYELSPFFELGAGDYNEKLESYASLRYTAIARHYEQNDYIDNVDHDVHLELQARLRKTLLNFDFRYKKLSTYDIDFGTIAERQLFDAMITTEYEINGKTTLELDLVGNYTDYKEGIDSYNTYANLWLNTLLHPKFRLSFGAVAGFMEQENESAQDYYRLMLRGRYYATEKVTVRGQVGVEYREFESREKWNFVGKLGVVYKPRESTSFSIDFNRDILASGAELGRNFLATGVTARVDQRLFGRLELSLISGYLNADYDVASFRGGQDRVDDVFFITPQVSFAIREWLRVSVFYTYRQNESSRENVSFQSNVFGVELTGQF